MKKQRHLLLALFFTNLISAQNQPNDCVNAVTVCGSGVFTSDVVSGPGIQEVVGCNNGREHNSVWLKVVVAQGGTFGFTLKPKSTLITADYDFWVFGPNKTYDNLGLPVRCCVTNPQQAGLSSNYTGIDGSTIATTAWSGTGGNNLAYVNWLNVKAGESYFIAIDRPYTVDVNGFDIEWTGTAAIANCATLGIENPTMMDLNIEVYPNPSNNSFSFDLNTVSQEPVQIKVYDMLGTLVEQIEGTPNKLIEKRIGQNYAVGIYNMVLTQGRMVKSIRIIKE